MRASLDCNEEVDLSKNLGKWSNIGYGRGSSLAKVYTMAKTSTVENSKHE
jgi:hypothetical protein